MDTIWANRLIAGTKTWAEMPQSRQKAVEAILRDKVETHELTEERFKEITGKDYAA